MRIASLVFVFLFLAACAPKDHRHKPIPGAIAKPTAQGSPGYDQMRPIFEQNCAACHPSRSAPNWLDFNQAQAFARNGALERKLFIERSMPPPGSAQAASFSENDRSLLVTWARAGGPLQAVTSASGDVIAEPPKQTLALQQQCFQCHGNGGLGNPSQASVPRLAGQNETYLAIAIARFKWRSRIDPSNGMNDVAANLSADQVKEMAAFFAKADPPQPPSIEIFLSTNETKVLYDRGKSLAASNCVSCHMNSQFGFKSIVPEVPLLGNQSEVYLRNQMLYFRNGERRNEVMNQISKGLTDSDISALALFFSLSR